MVSSVDFSRLSEQVGKLNVDSIIGLAKSSTQLMSHLGIIGKISTSDCKIIFGSALAQHRVGIGSASGRRQKLSNRQEKPV